MNPWTNLGGMSATLQDVAPTGTCFCGCGKATKAASFFLAGHDKKAESMLTRLQYGDENPVALRLVDAGYGPGGKRLFAEYQKMQEASASGRLEYFAMQSLQEMADRPGIAEAVVFVGSPELPARPRTSPAGVPQPVKTTILEVPLLGNVVAQGFASELTEREKHTVRDRFPGWQSTWRHQS